MTQQAAPAPVQAASTQSADNHVPQGGPSDMGLPMEGATVKQTGEVQAPPPPVEAPAEERNARIDAAIAKSKKAAEERRQLAQGKAASDQRAQQLEYQNQQMQRELQQAREWQDRARKNPLAHVRELGTDARTLAQEALNEGTPEATIAKMQARIDAMEAAAAQKEQQATKAQQQETLRAAKTEFTKAAGDESKYPTLSRQPPRAVLALAEQVISDARARNIAINNDGEILSFLEDHWSSYQKSRAAAVTQPLPSATPGAAPQSTAATPRTLPASPPLKQQAIEEIDPTLPEHEQKKKLVEIFERNLAAASRR
jgi:hypothetical protein